MLTPLFWNTLSNNQKKKLLERPTQSSTEKLTKTVRELIQKVQIEGDKALFSLTQKFDQVELSNLRVTPEEFDEAMNRVEPEVFKAFESAISQITAFHQKQRLSNLTVVTSPGIVCERLVVPIQRVGLYVPAGSAPLVSTVLMLGIPSRMSGCPLRVLCAPPNQAKTINPYLLVAASLCGIQDVFKVGGAQAIAAMAYGTETIPKVDKIFGPGNSWVTLAKMLVSLDPQGAQLDLPAGPSEVMVIADETANPVFVAADLLSQAEHGEDSQVFLISNSDTFAKAVNHQLEIQLEALSRKTIARRSLKQSHSIIVENLTDAISLVNAYAPEHLILQLANPRTYLPAIYNAGSIFLGPFSPESVGDYASGTNHVLPTAGFARSCSGLSVNDFMRTMSVQELTSEGLSSIAETIRLLTAIEGLDAHQKAIDLRLQEVRNGIN